MALYAFDGTGNLDQENDDHDTNVISFKELYLGHVEYIVGVGAASNALGNFIGTVTGLGGRSRINDMLARLAKNYPTDQIIDVIGFSRGASLAIHFCNCIAADGIKLASGEVVKPSIRFLGVWDAVGAFGIPTGPILPFQKINLGWKIRSIPSIVGHCFHALAFDEHRPPFVVTRLDKESDDTNLQEVWFRGTHLNIGGGNGNPPPARGRHNIALNWMVDHAKSVGLVFDEELRKVPKYSDIDLDAHFLLNDSAIKNSNRPFLENDAMHDSAKPIELGIDESHTLNIHADQPFNWSRVLLKKGQEYLIKTQDNSTWTDKNIEADPNGWRVDDEDVKAKINPFMRTAIKLSQAKRRVPDANWFTLCGSYGKDWNAKQYFAIGAEHRFVAAHTKELYTFANDLKSKYENNKGVLRATITRLN